MIQAPLSGCRVLIVEDEYYIAFDVVSALEEAGAIIVGPVNTLSDTMTHIEDMDFDIAILDIKLQDELIFPAADLLIERAVPFMFLTGYDRSYIPVQYSAVRFCEKPHTDALIEMLLDLRTIKRLSKP